MYNDKAFLDKPWTKKLSTNCDKRELGLKRREMKILKLP